MSCLRPSLGKWLLPLLVVGLIGYAAPGHAACRREPNLPQSLDFYFGNTVLNIPRDAPIGTVLAAARVLTNVNNARLWCNAGSYDVQSYNSVPGAIANGSSGITGTDGVFVIPGTGFGYRLVNLGDDTATGIRKTSFTVPSNFPRDRRCPDPNTACGQAFLGSQRLEIVKTSDFITATSFNAQTLMDTIAGGYVMARMRLMTALTIRPQTCEITTPSIAVRLTPDSGLRTSLFIGVGSTSPSVPFSLGLNCSGTAAKIGITFTDIHNPSNLDNALSLTESSSAAGLAVQILHNDTPVRYGRDTSVVGNLNQIMLATVNGTTGPINFPFTARYIQTASAVTAGTANAIATVTFSYQ